MVRESRTTTKKSNPTKSGGARKTAKTYGVVNAAWFKDRMDQLGLFHHDIAKLLEKDVTAISHMIRGKRKLQIEECPKIARLFGVSLEEVLANIGVPISTVDLETEKTILVSGYIDRALGVHWETPKSRSSADWCVASGCALGMTT